jgi:outer membrane protein OmpA-like peptidoglycan-associated protein
MLISNPKIKIRLEGHTDNMSNGNKSKKLAQKRIKSIKSWLVEKGISGKRIQLKAMGAEKRLTSVDALNARKINRRVEIRVIEI